MTTASTRSPRRRTVVALFAVLAVLCGFVVRLVDIQVVNAQVHIEESMEYALGSSRTLYGTRGQIVDADGDTLAGSILLYDGVLDGMPFRSVAKSFQAKTWRRLCEAWNWLETGDRSRIEALLPKRHGLGQYLSG